MAFDICLNCFQKKGDFEVCPHCGWIEDSAPEQAYHLHTGVILNERYIVGTVVGFGGFGVIYKVWDLQLAKEFAIKEFFPSGLVNRVPGETEVLIFSGEAKESYQSALQRFLEEARNIARFKNTPNVIKVLNYFEENSTAYIVMEFLEGVSLSDYLQANGGKLEPEEALQIIHSVMDGLAAIHNAGIVHRDVHPGNIFITASNQIKIIDFGAAKFATGEGEKTLTVVVTQGYASPEQYQSKGKQGSYTDIYGLGATLYKMLTGVLPDEAPDRQIEDTLKRPTELGVKIEANVDRAIMTALSVDPELRFQKIGQFSAAIFDNRKVGLPEETLKKRRIRRIIIAIVLGLIASGGITAIILFNTILKPLPSLENIVIAEDTISIWIPVEGNTQQQKKTFVAYQSISDSFMAENEQIHIELVPVPIEEYGDKLLAAYEVGELPTLYSSEYIPYGKKGQEASLDVLLRSINRKDYLFLENYEQLFPEENKMPLGFQALVLYETDAVEAQDGKTALSKVTSWNQLFLDKSSFVVDESSVTSLLALYNPSIAENDDKSASDNLGEMERQLKDAYPEGWGSNSDVSALSMLKDDKISFYIDWTSSLRSVQNTLPGYYRVVPVSHEGQFAGSFSNVWSVSKTSDENKRYAAMLFLSYLLNPYSQNVLYLQNDDAIPLNRDVFSDYIAINYELDFLNVDDEKFVFFQ